MHEGGKEATCYLGACWGGDDTRDAGVSSGLGGRHDLFAHVSPVVRPHQDGLLALVLPQPEPRDVRIRCRQMGITT